jgi:hypothetical protein
MVTKAKALANVRSKVNHEPVIDQAEYKISLINALNWYNKNNTSGDYKDWFIAHFRKRINFPTGLVHDVEYRTAGSLARILANGNELSEEHLARMESEFLRVQQMCLYLKSRQVEVVQVATTPVKRTPTIQERMNDRVVDFVGEFNGMIDQFIQDWQQPNVGALVKTMGITGPMGKKVMEKVQKPMAELNEVLEGRDKQLVEGWSNLKKTEIKRVLALYESLMEKLQQAKVTVPVKTRKVKVKPAGVIVQKLKYMKEHTELKIRSVQPATIVGASEVWVFNTKYNRLQCYVAADGLSISVKGTTLLNYHTEKSEQRTVRKPETIHVLNNAGKRTYSQYLKALTTKPSAPNGRINEECVILATFK